MAAFVDVVRFSLPVIGLLAAGAATIAAALFGVTFAIERLAARASGR